MRQKENLHGRMKAHGIWNITCRDKYGNIRWEEKDLHNINPNEGEEFFVDVLFDETQSVPANYYIGLTQEVSTNIDEETTLVTGTDGTDGTEASGNGYARQTVPSDATGFTNSLDATDWQAQTTTETFTASGGSIGPVDHAFLCTVASGTSGLLVSIVELSTERTILDGDSLDVNMTVKISQA